MARNRFSINYNPSAENVEVAIDAETGTVYVELGTPPIVDEVDVVVSEFRR